MTLILAGQPLPTLSFDALWHVGDLDVSKKKERSNEGQGLSVSVHPDAWVSIARLTGPTWEFTKANNAFCDYHSLSEAQKQAVNQWGLDRGYVVEQDVFEVVFYDGERDEDMSYTFLTYEEAEAEVNEEESVTVVTKFVATADFPDARVPAGSTDPHQVLVAAWVTENTDLDGVWWEDRYYPAIYSAPRGVIRTDMVNTWQRVVVTNDGSLDRHEGDDSDEDIEWEW